MFERPITLAVALVAFAGGPVFAASSEWEQIHGGAVRVVVSAEPDAHGRVRGALQVDLAPGWKTYWLDPGASGVPPTISVTANGQPIATEIGYPPPGRHSSGADVWAGYDGPVAFTLSMQVPKTAPAIDVAVFVGVCQEICIPVKADFHVELNSSASVASVEQAVDEAFDRLPAEAKPGFQVTNAEIRSGSLVVEAETPTGSQPVDLFMASSAGPVLGPPAAQPENGRTIFTFPLFDKLTGDAARLDYTLVAGEAAVAGTVIAK